MIDELGENPHVRSAALVAKQFGIDPVLVLKGNSGEGSYFDLALRVAAANYVAELEAEASKKSKAQQGQKVNVPNWIG